MWICIAPCHERTSKVIRASLSMLVLMRFVILNSVNFNCKHIFVTSSLPFRIIYMYFAASDFTVMLLKRLLHGDMHSIVFA